MTAPRRRGRPPKQTTATEPKVWTTRQVANIITNETRIYARRLRGIAEQLIELADDMEPPPIEDTIDGLKGYRESIGW